MISVRTLTIVLGGFAAVALLLVVLLETMPEEARERGEAAVVKKENVENGDIQSGEDAAHEAGKAVGATIVGRAKQDLLSGMNGLPDNDAREKYLAGVMARLASLKPMMALKQVRQLEDEDARDMVMLALLAEWSGTSVENLMKGGMVRRFGASGALAMHLLDAGEISPMDAVDLVKESGGGARQAGLLGRIATKLVGTDPQAALALAEGMDPRQLARFNDALARGWAVTAPAAARQWAMQIEDPAVRSRALASILRVETTNNPVAAAQSFSQFAPQNPAQRVRMAQSIAMNWAAKDTVSASQWAAGLSSEAERNAAQAGIQRSAPVGIGARIEAGSDGLPVLMDFIEGSPARLSGQLRTGDKVLAVGDGQGGWVESRGLALEQVVGMIRGAPNTQVTIRVQGADGSMPREITLGRQQIIHKETPGQ